MVAIAARSPAPGSSARGAKLGRWRILCTAMNAYKQVRLVTRSALAIIVPLLYARNTSVWSTIRLLGVFRLCER